MSEKKYNIFDPQLGEYYEEDITLEEAKETAIRLVERAMLEGGSDSENIKSYSQMLTEVQKDETFEDVAESLELFDYSLEEMDDDDSWCIKCGKSGHFEDSICEHCREERDE